MGDTEAVQTVLSSLMCMGVIVMALMVILSVSAAPRDDRDDE